jgi:hypothetical protein
MVGWPGEEKVELVRELRAAARALQRRMKGRPMDAETLTTTRSVRRRLDLERPVEPEVITACLRIERWGLTGD